MEEIKKYSNYSDENGNKIIGTIENCEVRFLGKNSTLTVGDNFIAKWMTIQLHSDCDVEIGSNVSAKDAFWNFYDGSVCSIGDNSQFAANGFLSTGKLSKIRIGNDFTTESAYLIISLPRTEIRFGKDCMMSRMVSVQSNDGHDIFDVNTGKNINSTEEIARNRKIIVGNHVWIGQEVMLMYNTDIADGSIVGAKSLVKGKFPNNCVIGGNPARLIKTDVAWNRSYGETDIGVIDKRYVCKTM